MRKLSLLILALVLSAGLWGQSILDKPLSDRITGYTMDVKLDPDAKILVVSAMGQRTIIDEMLKAGAVDYVIKPFMVERILEAVEKTACTT